MQLESFHPVIREWFQSRFESPTEAQRLGWPAIQAGTDTLIAAPTGSGKTLTAFLASLDRLLRLALAGTLEDRIFVVYVSPLRALSNDIQRNLEGPLAEILQLARQSHPDCAEIRALVRTGDTASKDRQKMLRRPPHILVTTPESLYLLLTGARSREMLRRVETVIIDEIHAVARDKRGSHLALSMERLGALTPSRPVRIGLSATQKPLDELARFLVGAHSPMPTIVDIGHVRELDLAIEVPNLELSAVCSHEQWAEIYDQLVQLIGEHRSTLIFVNTRKLAERVAHQLTARLGEDQVRSHHGSLAHASRQRTEQQFKDGSLKAVVATASLELGIDIGHIDLVCQLGTARSIATFLQRVGRAGHSIGVVPKGRLFALNRDELVECAALVRAVRAGRLDRVVSPRAPLDILAQQIVAIVAGEDWDEDTLFDLCRRSWPFRDLQRADYDALLDMLSEGISPSRGRWGAYLHRDRVHRRLHARRGARLTAITCGGAIPEVADYRVVTGDEPRTVVGTLDEDFAIESNAGDIFLLGNASWRVQHVRGGEVVVSDAHGAAPTVPFWLGEAPGRTPELSAEVGRLRDDIAVRAADGESAIDWLMSECLVSRSGAEQLHNYVAAQVAAVGMVPSQKRLLFERFFDESGGMQLVIHAPFGARINRAWGLAMRKRFCRSFDFELQAAADDNGIVLSLGAQHSFPLEQMFRLVPSKKARDVLVQAFLAAPFFGARWRWNITRSLQLRRFSKGRRVPPNLQRMRAEDLLSAVFPAQTACQENVVGDIAIPDQPIVRQTVHDCLHEAADLDGLLDVLCGIEVGEIETVGIDTREPSPFAHSILNTQPYAFLDDAPLEERRTRAVQSRRTLTADSVRDLGRLEPAAIEQVRSDAWPLVRDADELHDVLLSHGALPAGSAKEWSGWFAHLQSAGRAMLVETGGPSFWVAVERWPLVRTIWPNAMPRPDLAVPAGVPMDWSREDAIAAIVRGRMECTGPITAGILAGTFGLPESEIDVALAALENSGTILRGHFTGGAGLEWCNRRLLARIHRLTLDGLRRQIAPVQAEQFVRFLTRHQHLQPEVRLLGAGAVLAVVEQLEGFLAPAGHWEKHLLAARVEEYLPQWLDGMTFNGQIVWGRLRTPRAVEPAGRSRPIKAFTRSTPISLMLREHLDWLLPPVENPDDRASSLGSNAEAAYDAFLRHGALFPNQLGVLLGLVSAQVDDVLGELAAAGLITSDGFPALRTMMAGPSSRRRRENRRSIPALAGRWTLLRSALSPAVNSDERIENWCRLLLRRYGIVFRDLLANEWAAPPWSELVRTYRKLESRGEIRGGRFVAGVGGEQYALAEAIPALRACAEESVESPIIVSATDPLNLTGRLGSSARIPALLRHFISIVSGRLVKVDALPRSLGKGIRSQQITVH